MHDSSTFVSTETLDFEKVPLRKITLFGLDDTKMSQLKTAPWEYEKYPKASAYEGFRGILGIQINDDRYVTQHLPEEVLMGRTLELDEDEQVTQISGRAWGFIDFLRIETSKQKILELGNEYGGQPFRLTKAPDNLFHHVWIQRLELGVGVGYDQNHLGHLHYLKVHYLSRESARWNAAASVLWKSVASGSISDGRA